MVSPCTSTCFQRLTAWTRAWLGGLGSGCWLGNWEILLRQDDVCLQESDSFSRAVPSGNVTVMKLRQTDHNIRIARDAAGMKVAKHALIFDSLSAKVKSVTSFVGDQTASLVQQMHKRKLDPKRSNFHLSLSSWQVRFWCCCRRHSSTTLAEET